MRVRIASRARTAPHVFVAQWRERQVADLEAAGSSPAEDTHVPRAASSTGRAADSSSACSEFESPAAHSEVEEFGRPHRSHTPEHRGFESHPRNFLYSTTRRGGRIGRVARLSPGTLCGFEARPRCSVPIRRRRRQGTRLLTVQVPVRIRAPEQHHITRVRRRGRVGLGCNPGAIALRGFESLHPHARNAFVAQWSRAPGSDPEGRWFESSRGHARGTVECPRGQGAACKAVHAGSNPASASIRRTSSTVERGVPGRCQRPCGSSHWWPVNVPTSGHVRARSCRCPFGR